MKRVVTESTVNALIRKWRIARLTRDENILDYPSINVIHPEHGIRSGQPTEETDSDVLVVQGLVDALPEQMRLVFEAFHLGIVRGEYMRKAPHSKRWRLLNLDRHGYHRAEKEARERMRRQLLNFFHVSVE